MVHTNDFLPEKNSIGEREKMIIGQWVAAGVAQCLQHGVAQWRWWGVEQRPFLPETIPAILEPPELIEFHVKPKLRPQEPP